MFLAVPVFAGLTGHCGEMQVRGTSHQFYFTKYCGFVQWKK